MEIADKEKVGDHAAAKHHSKNNESHENTPAPEAFFGKRIGA
jgi:hypothetical protein